MITKVKCNFCLLLYDQTDENFYRYGDGTFMKRCVNCSKPTGKISHRIGGRKSSKINVKKRNLADINCNSLYC
jgi:hypothetical protein